MMKKLSLYIFLGLMWCNVGFAKPVLLQCIDDNPIDANEDWFDYLSLDLDKKSVTFKEKNIPISSQEFTVMKILAKNINTYLEDSEIEENAIKENSDILKSSVPITIYRLRKKLSKIPGGTKLIKSKRGKGYSLSVN